MKKFLGLSNNQKFDEAMKGIENIGSNSFDEVKISKSIDENSKYLKMIFENCYDIVQKKFKIGSEQIDGFIVYVNGIVDKNFVTEKILNTLMTESRLTELEKKINKNKLIEFANKNITSIGDTKKVYTIQEALDNILKANCVLFIDGNDNALAFNIKTYESRDVSTPITESVIRGPMEGYTENINTNTALLRNRVKTINLKTESFEIGSISKTTVVICYIHGLIDIGILKELRERIEKIEVDMINDSGEIEHYIEDSTFSPFPQVGVTERPDTCAAALAEGRATILVDGSPFALVVPNVFAHFLTAPEDKYNRFYFTSFIRLLRYISFFISLFLPSLYVALITFHQEMIPSSLLITVASSYAGIPFPAVVEAFLLEFTFEILREAGLRLPKPIGQAVNIVGALIIGEAGVQAGLSSRAMVVIVAFTGITSFAMPGYNAARIVRVFRFLLLVLGGTFGLFGIAIGALFILVHMASLRSFGVPYLSPLAPIHFKDWKDLFIKFPSKYIKDRPTFIQKYNLRKRN
ncbi:spore germination protein [Sporosalibacterium faouarense]|uniref:spore germination protein n=1 Tax=Sporosalibacterium faouarense TaxID=516123 RepID=UPI00141CDFCC|nr:spore germination protein [Sporosalibacterium faouarense]MTI49620.1 spore germination protein [Bacillota bacterium]